ncbi:aminobenzoyl-glutamate transport protein [Erwinia toletana]|uniref:Aminobenzoyl-glutamate transport protein n=1 Tax=Winslowiella toletana TaxID=92490 RepID=A0ABS4P7P9_9GAMM|nr:AbgT family transporter [Winslowiella toletana]MBP2168681.1 aminobenzoyl-glutamate transport protein [Winslowiella toletana]
MTDNTALKPPGPITRLLNTIEWLGNLLPHPVTLFAILCLVIIVASGIAAGFNLSVIDPRPEGASGRAADGIVQVVNLLSAEGLQRIVSNMVTNFTSFAPLGTVLVAMIGVGIAEQSGLLSAAMRALVFSAPKRMLTFTVVFAGIISNTASELGYVVLIPLSAMLFHSLGRHPLAGLAAAFAGVSGGYSANLLLGTVDPLLSGITQNAAQIIDPAYIVGPEVNWYFMTTSTFVIAGLGTWITTSIIEPKLGKYRESDGDAPQGDLGTLTPQEKRALKGAGITLLVMTLLVSLTLIPGYGLLLNQSTGSFAGSPFLHGIVVFIMLFFAIPGYVYGRITGTLRSDRDVINAMAKSISMLSLYIVLVFFAAQFVAFFNWSNFGTIIAVKGATMLSAMDINAPLLFGCFILICGFINLMIGSSSAQWAVTAPIFVPMLMLVGYAPEVIQAAYRIGDSVTNLITPMMSYFGLIMAVAARYQRNLGIGTLVALMLPYSVMFLIGWSLLFVVWVFGFGLPVGPGAATFYNL